MRCRKCGTDLCHGSMCQSCLKKFTDIRKQVWDELVSEMGKPTKDNMALFQKKFKKREKAVTLGQHQKEG